MPDVNTEINAYCNARKFDEAIELFTEMPEEGLIANVSHMTL